MEEEGKEELDRDGEWACRVVTFKDSGVRKPEGPDPPDSLWVPHRSLPLSYCQGLIGSRKRLSGEQVLHNKPSSSACIIDERARPRTSGPAKCGGGLRTWGRQETGPAWDLAPGTPAFQAWAGPYPLECSPGTVKNVPS